MGLVGIVWSTITSTAFEAGHGLVAASVAVAVRL